MERRRQGIIVMIGIVGLALCGLTGYWASLHGEGQPVEPTPMTAPTESAYALFLQGAATLTPVPAADGEVEVPTIKLGGGGESCLYSSAKLNEKLPPVPDGGRTPTYECVDGHWRAVVDRINNETGEWGSDGKMEVVLVKYDKNGKIVDRIWRDLQGNIIVGPAGD